MTPVYAATLCNSPLSVENINNAETGNTNNLPDISNVQMDNAYTLNRLLDKPLLIRLLCSNGSSSN